MIRIHPVTAAAVASTVALSISSAQAPSGVQRSALHDYRVVTVAEGLMNPWSIAFLPGGDMLVTERPGRLRSLRERRQQAVLRAAEDQPLFFRIRAVGHDHDYLERRAPALPHPSNQRVVHDLRGEVLSFDVD